MIPSCDFALDMNRLSLLYIECYVAILADLVQHFPHIAYFIFPFETIGLARSSQASQLTTLRGVPFPYVKFADVGLKRSRLSVVVEKGIFIQSSSILVVYPMEAVISDRSLCLLASVFASAA